MYLANVLKFAMNQLQDAPTEHSVIYLHTSLWSSSVSSLIALVINIPGHRYAVNTPDRIVKFDSLQTSIALCILFFAALSLIIILCIVHKRQR